jgi:hypothetical protein
VVFCTEVITDVICLLLHNCHDIRLTTHFSFVVVLTCCLQAGWSLDQCKSCGKNVLSDTTSTDGLGLSPEQCYIPAGWGTEYEPSSRQLVAQKCRNGKYGNHEDVYGLGATPCKVRCAAGTESAGICCVC